MGTLRQLIKIAGTDYGGKMKDLNLLEKCYIRSQTDYTGEAWIPVASKTALSHIDVVQKTAARWITGATRNTNGTILGLQIGAPPAEFRARRKAGIYYERCRRQPASHPIRGIAEAV